MTELSPLQEQLHRNTPETIARDLAWLSAGKAAAVRGLIPPAIEPMADFTATDEGKLIVTLTDETEDARAACAAHLRRMAAALDAGAPLLRGGFYTTGGLDLNADVLLGNPPR